MQLQSGELYFVREREYQVDSFTNYVKIGLVREREGRSSFDRLREHQTGNPRDLVLPPGNVLITPAIDRVEALMHNIFATRRISGEWFLFANEMEIEGAISRAKDLISETESFSGLLANAEALEGRESFETIIATSDEIIEISSRLSLAKGKLKVLVSIQSQIGNLYKAAHSEGRDLGKGAATIQRKLAPKFDQERFELENSELFQRYLETSRKWDQRFLFKVKPTEIGALPHEFQNFVEEITRTVANLGCNLDLLNDPLLNVTREIALAEWEIETTEAELKNICGENAGIDSVCTWVRKWVEKSVFDAKRLAEEYPKLYSSYLVEQETKTYVQPKKKKI